MAIRSKGGVLRLLSFFLLAAHISTAQNINWSVEKNPESENYGQVSILGLGPGDLSRLTDPTLTFREWALFFSLRAGDSQRPMLGTYAIVDTQIVFSPRFLPDPEITYHIYFSSTDLKKHLTNFTGKTEINATLRFDPYENKIDGIITYFPEIDTLPANILRMYLQFPDPMSFENPYQHISIADASGIALNDAFVEIEEGLWNPERTRLTLLFHPGRIKRGVGPNVTQGEIFEKGKSYQLFVSEKWKTSSGIPIGKRFVRNFFISGEIRKIIDPFKWNTKSVSGGTKEALIIQTTELLDKALAERLIIVIDEKGSTVKGDLRYDAESRQLIFTPGQNWETGSYAVVTGPKLEDVCGNTMYNVFDLKGEGMIKNGESREITFHVK